MCHISYTAIRLFDNFTKFEAKALNRFEHSKIANYGIFNSLKIVSYFFS